MEKTANIPNARIINMSGINVRTRMELTTRFMSAKTANSGNFDIE